MGRKKNVRRMMLVAVLALGAWGATVQAENIDMLSCGAGNVNVIAGGEELTAMIYEAKGINLDNLGNKAFDNMTFHCGALFKIEKGKMSGPMLCKYMDPGGDYFVVEVLQAGMERDWKFVHSTGKWKGITGGGKSLSTTKGKPIAPGTNQACYKITGTYELKK
jgi:hypothetical protein